MTSLGLFAYRAATRAFGPFAGMALRARARRGKEDPARIDERFARAETARPSGVMVWMHAASVGESLMLLPLIAALKNARPNLNFVLTTNTLTSATLLADRLPDGVIHQFAPLDRPDVARRFFEQWRPSLAVFVESELWPNLILEAETRGVPLALVNARMTEKSIEGWRRRAPGSARRLLSAFAWIGAADTRTAEGLSELAGIEIASIGNLKQSSAPPPAEPETLARLRALIEPRPVWLAASTHPGEDEIALDAHASMREETEDWLLIIAPRHPERGPDILSLAEERGFASARRGSGAEPGPEHSVYVADTLGELGLWYRLARAAVICGSLEPQIGGHNPLEAALVDTPILTGPHAHNFETMYAELCEAGGAEVVSSGVEIARALRELTPELRLKRASAARRVAMNGESVLETTVMALRQLLPASADARA